MADSRETAAVHLQPCICSRETATVSARRLPHNPVAVRQNILQQCGLRELVYDNAGMRLLSGQGDGLRAGGVVSDGGRQLSGDI